jgi:predicted AAA+ superfamily ATPase
LPNIWIKRYISKIIADNIDLELFLKQYANEKIFIDEAQYAPNLFPSIKRKIDLYKRQNQGATKTILRITGSNQIQMDKNIKESLAGRARRH